MKDASGMQDVHYTEVYTGRTRPLHYRPHTNAPPLNLLFSGSQGTTNNFFFHFSCIGHICEASLQNPKKCCTK